MTHLELIRIYYGVQTIGINLVYSFPFRETLSLSLLVFATLLCGSTVSKDVQKDLDWSCFDARKYTYKSVRSRSRAATIHQSREHNCPSLKLFPGRFLVENALLCISTVPSAL
jgi:hypothetical protein